MLFPTRAGAADVLRPLLRQRLDSGDATARAGILPVSGSIATADDVPILLGFLTAGFPVEVREAARVAFRRATAPGINDRLLDAVTSPDDQAALNAMKVLVDRYAVSATGPLWELVLGPESPRRSPALDALGKLMPVADIPMVWQRMNEADGTPMLARLAEVNWAVLRRHPDPAAAATAMMQTAAHSKQATKDLLERQATRLRSRTDDTAKVPAIKVPEEKDPSVLAPDQHDLLLALDCGPSSGVEHSGTAIRRVEGATFAFGGSTHPLATVDYGKLVTYEITGLNPKEAYVLGLAAWDGDRGGRNQMLRINGRTIIPEFLPLAYHNDQPVSARFHVPLDGLVPPDGKVTIGVHCLAGPNAVVSELRLYQRKAGVEERRKILILTGDDHPAHLWRETGPGLAAILRADARFEVTISESPYLLGSEVLDHYDAALIHFKNYGNRTPTTTAMRENLARYVEGGGGLVVAHFGCGAMQDWDGFVRVAGRVWDPAKHGHDPYGEFLVRFTDRTHPLVSGLADFQTSDELYTCLSGTTEIQILAAATSKLRQTGSSHGNGAHARQGAGISFPPRPRCECHPVAGHTRALPARIPVGRRPRTPKPMNGNAMCQIPTPLDGKNVNVICGLPPMNPTPALRMKFPAVPARCRR